MNLIPQWFIQHGRARLLARGEAGIALIGISMVMVLIICLAADNLLTNQAGRAEASTVRQSDLQAAGSLFANLSAQYIASGNLAELRKTTVNFASSLGLKRCSVSIGNQKILADMHPARVNVFTLPEHWTAEISDTDPVDSASTCLRLPFIVPGKGPGTIALTVPPLEASNQTGFGVPATICAIGLGVLAYIYRRSRRALAEMDVIRSSIAAMDQGETSVAALQVDPLLGKAAVAWNKLLGDFENLRRRTALSPAVTTNGNRRAGGSNLDAACDAMSQGLILVDDKMRVRFSNGAACTFLKHDRTSLADSVTPSSPSPVESSAER
jgi:hypothetical protein